MLVVAMNLTVLWLAILRKSVGSTLQLRLDLHAQAVCNDLLPSLLCLGKTAAIPWRWSCEAGRYMEISQILQTKPRERYLVFRRLLRSVVRPSCCRWIGVMLRIRIGAAADDDDDKDDDVDDDERDGDHDTTCCTCCLS